MAFNSQNAMSHLNTTFDPDYDSFLNLDTEFAATASSPALKSVPMLTPQSSVPGSSTPFASSSAQQTFPGPSFQYDAYHQQTGIPLGALANTFALNKASGLHYNENNGGFVMPTETLNMPLSNLDDFDFSRPGDMDLDYDNSAQFVSPNTLMTPNTASTPVQRIYPGMHSQQAAQAKAQAEQKRQEMARQQQQRPAGQKPLPAGPSPTKTQPAKDPLVEESISRVLNRMRQESVASTKEEDEDSPSGMSNLPRLKKDDEDMDEDERLLASEEGKKLSSKERRQLRNKVSARAFRSRRKEYISQLEGEVAAKSHEANELRAQNEQLREENNRLTDLTRMLLSSQAFHGFLQELSQSGTALPQMPTQAPTQSKKSGQKQQQQQAPQPQPNRKDVNPSANQQQMQGQQQQPQIGMALIPETNFDLSSMIQPSQSWMMALPNDYQVYSVTELPEPPRLDLAALTEKPCSISSIPSSGSSKDAPRLPEVHLPATLAESPAEEQVDPDVTLDRESFALYFATTASSSSTSPVPADLPVVELSADEQQVCLEKLLERMDEICDRVAEFTQ